MQRKQKGVTRLCSRSPRPSSTTSRGGGASDRAAPAWPQTSVLRAGEKAVRVRASPTLTSAVLPGPPGKLSNAEHGLRANNKASPVPEFPAMTEASW